MTGVGSLAGACALALALAVPLIGRIHTALRIVAVQSLATAVAAGAQGWAQNVPSLYVAAPLALALNGFALPLVLHRRSRRLPVRESLAYRYGFAPSLAASFILVAASVDAAMPMAGQGQMDLLALGLSVLLVGLLLPALRSHDLVSALGLLLSQNGGVLAASAIPGLPLSALLIATVPLVPSLVIAEAWLRDRNRLAPMSPC
jgi:hydrogenase-4 membrane subunit HyfE